LVVPDQAVLLKELPNAGECAEEGSRVETITVEDSLNVLEGRPSPVLVEWFIDDLDQALLMRRERTTEPRRME